MMGFTTPLSILHGGELLCLSCDESSLQRERVDIFMDAVTWWECVIRFQSSSLRDIFHERMGLRFMCGLTSRQKLVVADPRRIGVVPKREWDHCGLEPVSGGSPL